MAARYNGGTLKAIASTKPTLMEQINKQHRWIEHCENNGNVKVADYDYLHALLREDSAGWLDVIESIHCNEMA